MKGLAAGIHCLAQAGDTVAAFSRSLAGLHQDPSGGWFEQPVKEPPVKAPPVTALEVLNQAGDDIGLTRAEQAATAEITRLEAAPDGRDKDYDGIAMRQAILGFAQLKLNKLYDGHLNISKSKAWLNTQLKPYDARYNSVLALASAADAYDLSNKGNTRKALEEAKAAYKADSSIVVVAITLAQMQNVNGRHGDGNRTLQQFRRQHPEDARRSQLFIQVERTLGP